MGAGLTAAIGRLEMGRFLRLGRQSTLSAEGAGRTIRKRRLTFRSSWVMILAALAVGVIFALFPSAGFGTVQPTISSDQADYSPGATVTLTGANWQSGEAVHIAVNDNVGQT